MIISTGQQQISYIYEGYNNDYDDYYSPATYGNFLPEGYDLIVGQNDDFPRTKSVKFLDQDFRGSKFSRSRAKDLTALPSTTSSSSLLAGTTLDTPRTKKKNRFRGPVSTDLAVEKRLVSAFKVEEFFQRKRYPRLTKHADHKRTIIWYYTKNSLRSCCAFHGTIILLPVYDFHRTVLLYNYFMIFMSSNYDQFMNFTFFFSKKSKKLSISHFHNFE